MSFDKCVHPCNHHPIKIDIFIYSLVPLPVGPRSQATLDLVCVQIFDRHKLFSLSDKVLGMEFLGQVGNACFWVFFKFYLFMAVLGLRFCARAFSNCGERGPLFIAVRGPPTIAVSSVAEHRLQTRRLSSCGSRAQSLRGMWDPPRPGLEPVSPALAGTLPTTAPTGKPPEMHAFINLFIFGSVGSCCCARAFSSCRDLRLLFVVVHRLLIAVASLAVEHRL